MGTCKRRATAGGSPSTNSAGAHSATVTFCRKCALSRKWSASVSTGVAKTATSRRSEEAKQAMRQRSMHVCRTRR
jgi:hypothetical protein